MRSSGGSRNRSMPSSPLIDRIVVGVAPNGARKTRKDHPALPITPQELADCAAACRDAGASMLHLHVRNTAGGHSLAPGDYRPAIEAVRRAVGQSLVLQLTSEALGIYAPAEQQAMVRELRPEAVSLALREILPDAASEPQGAAFLGWAHREEIVVQFILYGPDDVERYGDLRWRGVIPEGRHWVLFVLGRYTAGQRSSLADLLPMLSAWRAAGEATAGVPWANCAFGSREIECSLGAAALGGHVRIGFENNLQLPDSRIARDNAELIGCFAELAGQLGHSLADADQLRSLFI
jgi:3-keto-5-aminohexanoate cleavage enzyme